MPVSASFSNVLRMSRISYQSVPDPTLIWYKFNAGDIGTNTIYNYATGTTNTTVGTPSLDYTTYKTGTSSLYLTGTQYIIPPTFNFSSYSGNTFSFWFKIPSKSITTDGACLVQFSNNTSYDLAEHLFIWNRPTNTISDYIYNSGRNYEFFFVKQSKQLFIHG